MVLDWRIKGLPPVAEGLSADEIGGLGLRLLEGDLMMPVAVLREGALHANIAAMQAFIDGHGAKLCPHGKTSMSPELFQMQLDAGAWGLSAATAHHVRVYRRLGVKRILLANQLVGRADIDCVIGEIAADPDFDFYCLVDSVEAADLLADAAAEARCPRPVQLLMETGLAGGRTGLRGIEDAAALARHIAASPWLALRGIETYEGIYQARQDARGEARDMLAMAAALTEAAIGEDLFAPGPILLSAGGSAFLDLCTAELPSTIGGRPIERVLRPGCYVTHDSGLYVRLTEGGEARGLPPLHHALEVWGVVQSVPEEGLAIVNVGKRDAGYDVEPPIPLWTHRPGAAGGPRPAQGLRIRSLWDQHLSLDIAPGAVAVGDLIGFGVSHLCSTFDRWRALMMVDGSYRVTGVVTTLF